jgi:prepilin-type N-terminal cleavage/methylation domain-containing protein
MPSGRNLARSCVLSGSRREQERHEMKITVSRTSGFTLVEIMVVVAIIGLLSAIAVPNFIQTRQAAQVKTCLSNLRQIDYAKQQWALENRAGGGATPTEADIGVYLGRNQSLTNIVCPASPLGATFADSYNINSVSNPPTCKNYDEITHNAVLH